VTFSTSANPNFTLEEDIKAYEGSIVTPGGVGLDEALWLDLTATPKLELSDMMSPEFIRSMPKAKGGDDWTCLTEALYFEARGEKLEGIFAVADVILNRVDSPRYPDTVCGVVRQGTGDKWMCQFSYYCDGEPEYVSEPAAWEKVGKVARIMLDSEDRRITHGATHYHTKSVRPSWSKVFPRVTTIGYHHFYRET
jgi:spore germination cell wall hydrolase CwlJ-like protein